MGNENKFELVISIVNRGYSDVVVGAANEAGARGGTIIYGRGTGIHERESIMGVSIQPEKEIIMTLTASDKKADIMKNICEKAEIDKTGMGICFSLPVSEVRGISQKNKQKINNKKALNN